MAKIDKIAIVLGILFALLLVFKLAQYTMEKEIEKWHCSYFQSVDITLCERQGRI